jgi:hypothetical protein
LGTLISILAVGGGNQAASTPSSPSTPFHEEVISSSTTSTASEFVIFGKSNFLWGIFWNLDTLSYRLTERQEETREEISIYLEIVATGRISVQLS